MEFFIFKHWNFVINKCDFNICVLFVLIFRKSQILIICGVISTVVSINQFEPADDYAGGNSECALLLEGPGRSSAFDYSLNTLRGTP